MQDQMHDFVTERVVAEFVGRIPLNEKTASGMNAARPFFQASESLKLLPFLWPLENIDVRFDVGRQLLPLQLFCDDAIMEFCFNGNGRSYVAVDEMVDEMFGLGMFPLVGTNREGFLAERVWV